MTKNRFPTRVALAANVIVYVKRAGPDVLAGIVDKGTSGVWDFNNKTIWIDKTLSTENQWRALRHELQHAIIDVHEELAGGIGEVNPGLVPPGIPERTPGVSADAAEVGAATQ